MEDQKCTGNHSQHMCTLLEEKQTEMIRRLSDNPQYICANCGRPANSEDNLCSPVDVDASRYM